MRSEWARTALVCSVVSNTVPRKSKRVIKPDAFSPYRLEEERVTFKDLLKRMKRGSYDAKTTERLD